MRIYRLCSARNQTTAFTGLGASLAGGRWNHKGVEVVYTAGSLSLAALECLVHFSSQTLPSDYISFEVTVHSEVSVETIAVASLPANWQDETPPVTTQSIGTEWINGQRSLLLKVPSIIIPTEFNFLINPGHQEFSRLIIGQPVPFRFDPRLKE